MPSFRIVDFRFAIKCFDRVDLLLRNFGLPYDTSVISSKIQILAKTRLFQVPFAKMETLSDGSFVSLSVVRSVWFNRYVALRT